MTPPPPPPPEAATLAWQWVIETLAGLDSVDTSLLSAAISAVPDFWIGASDALRERIALRYLEEYAGDAWSGGEIDATRSSEEILCSLLRKEVGPVGVQRPGAEQSSHALRQFILQKRATLPKSSLDLLKNLILEDCCGTGLISKETSDLWKPDQVDYLQHNNGGKNMLKFNTFDGQNHSGIQGSLILSPNCSNVNFQIEFSRPEKHLGQEELLGSKSNLEEGIRNHLSGNIGCNVDEVQSSKLAEMTKHVGAPGLDSCNMSLQDPSSFRQHLPEMNVLDRKGKINVQLGSQHFKPLLPCMQAEMTKHVIASTLDNCDTSFPNHSASQQYLPVTNVSDGKTNDIVRLVRQSSSSPLTCKQAQMTKNVDSFAPGSCNLSLQDPTASPQHLLETNLLDCKRKSTFQLDGPGCPSVLLCKQNNSLQQAPLNGSGKDVSEHFLCRNDHFDGEASVVPDTPCLGSVSDSPPFNLDPNDEILDSERKRLLSSQIHDNIDSVAGKCFKQVRCIKCDEGGQVLSCSADGCLIAVHENCLVSSGNFEGTDLFYCPFCSYARASIAYRKAREALSAFIGKGLVERRRKKLPLVNTNVPHLNTSVYVVNSGELPSVEVTAPICEKSDVCVTNLHGEADNGYKVNSVEDLQQCALPDTTMEDGNLPHEGLAPNDIRIYDASKAPQKDRNFSDEHDHTGNVKDQEDLRTTPDKETWRRESARLLGKRLFNKRCDAVAQKNVKNMKRKKPSPGSSSKHAAVESQHVRSVPDHAVVSETSNSDLPNMNVKRRLDAIKDKLVFPHESVEKSKRQKTSPTRSSTRGARPKIHSGQRVILGRRKTVFWTSEEEEILKEAVQRFASDVNGNHPWRRILEFGRHVFHPTRDPVDLKDKWRNLKRKKECRT